MKAKRKSYLFTACLITILILSCGKNKKSGSTLLESMGEGEKFARTLYGENSVIIAKGDLNGNGLPDILTGIVNRKENENKFWIEKGGLLENNGVWKTIVSFDTRLSTDKGGLVEMIDADNGYVISFDSKDIPMDIFISIADSNGNSVSDEAMIKWNKTEKTYKFIPNPEILINDSP